MPSLSEHTDCPQYRAKLEASAGHRMFDIGANGGSTARLFAPTWDEVYAFEPAQESFDDLVESVPENVVPLNIAISDHLGVVRLREASRSIASGQLVDGDSLHWGETLGYRDVLCTTVDDAAEHYGFPDGIKVDVEGHEMHVLSGASSVIAAGQTKWFLEVHSSDFEARIRDIFSAYTVTHMRHSYYQVRSDGWREHFYMVAVP